MCVCTPEHGDRVSFINSVPEQFSGRGHRPVLDTCANEAIPRWGKGGLINHLYLKLRPTLKCVASIMGRIVKLSLHSCCNLSLCCLVLSVFLRISMCRAKVCVFSVLVPLHETAGMAPLHACYASFRIRFRVDPALIRAVSPVRISSQH